MAKANPPSDPFDRARIELRCLGRAVIPMPEDNGTKVAKAVALILVVTWCVSFLALTFEVVEAVSPPYYAAFTALTFLVVGKLWDIEVKSMIGRK